jgi:hypothetical protein
MKYLVVSINQINNIRKIIGQYPTKEHALSFAIHKMAENINQGCCSIFIHQYYTNNGYYGSQSYIRKYDSLVACIKNCALCSDNIGCEHIYKVEKILDDGDSRELK